MTGINLTIKKDGITKPYSILYAELYGQHIGQIIDETVTVIHQIIKSNVDECHNEIINFINSLGTVTWVGENRPDELLIKMITELRSEN
jgi:hypothetical protein